MKRTKKVKAQVMRSALAGEYWAIPRTAADYDALVEQMMKAIFMGDPEPHWHRINLRPYYEEHARAALRAIGITRPKEDKP